MTINIDLDFDEQTIANEIAPKVRTYIRDAIKEDIKDIAKRECESILSHDGHLKNMIDSCVREEIGDSIANIMRFREDPREWFARRFSNDFDTMDAKKLYEALAAYVAYPEILNNEKVIDRVVSSTSLRLSDYIRNRFAQRKFIPKLEERITRCIDYMFIDFAKEGSGDAEEVG